MVYGAAVPAFSDQITGFVNGQNPSVVTGTASISTSASSASSVAGGPYPITIAAGSLSAPNYSFTNLVGGLLTVTPAPLTVTANNASMVYGAAVPTFSDQITGFVNGQNSSLVTGTPIFSTTASSTSTVAGGPYTISIAAGTLSAANYTFTSFGNGSLTVNPAPLTVTANNVSMLYGAAVPVLSDQITGFVNGQNSSLVTGTPIISTTASSTSTVAGGPYTIAVTAGTLSAPNYSFTNLINGLLTVTPAPLTVTANNASMLYGAAIPALSDQITGFVNGQNSSVVTGAPTISSTVSSTSTVAGGPYPVTITAGSLSAANYEFATFQNGSLTVNPAPLTVTANNASMVYGATVPTLSVQITGFVNGQNSSIVTGAATISTSASSTSSVAGGPYPITITASTFSAPNYSFTNLINGLLTVTPAPLTVTANNASMVYGAAVPTLSDQITGFVNGQNSSIVTGTATISTSASSASSVAGGPYPITITAGTFSAPNYSFTNLINGLLTVTPAPLAVTANNASIVYGAAVPAFSDQITGFVNGQGPSVVIGKSSITTTATSASHEAGGPYPIRIAAGSLSAANYTFTTFNNGSLSVTPAHLTVTANSATKLCGAAVPVLTDHDYRIFQRRYDCRRQRHGEFGRPQRPPQAMLGSTRLTRAAGTLDADRRLPVPGGQRVFGSSLRVLPAPLTITATSAAFDAGGAVPSLDNKLQWVRQR